MPSALQLNTGTGVGVLHLLLVRACWCEQGAQPASGGRGKRSHLPRRIFQRAPRAWPIRAWLLSAGCFGLPALCPARQQPQGLCSAPQLRNGHNKRPCSAPGMSCSTKPGAGLLLCCSCSMGTPGWRRAPLQQALGPGGEKENSDLD